MSERFARVAAGTAVLGLGVVLALDLADALSFGWGWCWPALCVVGGCGLLTVARPDPTGAYAGAITRLAANRTVPVWPLRAVTVLTAPLAGLGVAAYAGLTLRQALDRGQTSQPRIDWRRTTGTGLIGLSVVLAFIEVGAWVGGETVLWSILLAGSGLSLFWWLPDSRRGPATGLPRVDEETPHFLAFGLVGVALIFILASTGLFSQGGRTIAGAAAGVVVLALVVGPRWVRNSRALVRERTQRIRATERTELAGLLHDSVLQTFALIQDRADDPTEVRALVRRQERDLRAWLLDTPSAAAAPPSITGGLRAMAAEVEDAHRVKIDVVTVGDAPITAEMRALIEAAREALVNAAKHAPGAPISLFAEIEEDRVAAYVRDRGPGFDVNGIPSDRHGVRDSIVARMVRNGGHAAVRTAPGGGCEVRLVQERIR